MKLRFFTLLAAACFSAGLAGDAYGQNDLLGDLNCDGLINGAEIPFLIEALQTGSNDPAADYNQDGVVNFSDITPFTNLTEFELGDGNFDGTVSFADIPSFQAALQTYNRQHDFDGDGDVDGIDSNRFLMALAGTAPLSIIGDLNGDDLVNSADIGPFIAELQSGGSNTFADINQDGVVNFSDIGPFTDLLQLPLGDGNGDGIVNGVDISMFINTLSAGVYNRRFDMNGDGIVSFLDISGLSEVAAKY